MHRLDLRILLSYWMLIIKRFTHLKDTGGGRICITKFIAPLFSSLQKTCSTNQHSLTEVIACKEICRPALEEIVQTTGECAHLAVLVEDRVWYIDKVDSLRPLGRPPDRFSITANCTALGKLFGLGNAKIPSEFRFILINTVIYLYLHRELLQTRSIGFAIDNEEFSEGIRCAAYPLFDGARRYDRSYWNFRPRTCPA